MKLKDHLLFYLLILIGMLLSACGPDIETNMSQPMVDFSFTTQDEETLTMDDLKGDWWLAFMSYTHCRTVCPRTTANMVAIQKTLQESDLHPHIVSFSIDPEKDTPGELRKYAELHGADLTSWDFLTGYDFEEIQTISEEVFHAGLEKGAVDQFSHSYMFYLVNDAGEVVKQYDGMGPEESKKLIEDVKTVLN